MSKRPSITLDHSAAVVVYLVAYSIMLQLIRCENKVFKQTMTPSRTQITQAKNYGLKEGPWPTNIISTPTASVLRYFRIRK